MAEVQGLQIPDAANRANLFGKATNALGGILSLALIAGVGVWGYKLLVRDVSGVPVVRAAEGPIRVQPENPGGTQALNQGLSVNNVAAEGAAAASADRLILAPKPLKLTLEDEPISTELNLPAAKKAPAKDEALETVQLASVDMLVNQIVAGVEPLTELLPSAKAEPEAVTSEPEKTAVVVAGGLGRSLRPQVRPATLQTATRSAGGVSPSAVQEADADSIPVGTRLAQLGAYESAEVARKEWERLSGNFGAFLEDKTRVIQKAKSGGRTFYRLRAMGFADLSDARRFCSALVAEKAECIPVVTR